MAEIRSLNLGENRRSEAKLKMLLSSICFYIFSHIFMTTSLTDRQQGSTDSRASCESINPLARKVAQVRARARHIHGRLRKRQRGRRAREWHGVWLTCAFIALVAAPTLQASNQVPFQLRLRWASVVARSVDQTQRNNSPVFA